MEDYNCPSSTPIKSRENESYWRTNFQELRKEFEQFRLHVSYGTEDQLALLEEKMIYYREQVENLKALENNNLMLVRVKQQLLIENQAMKKEYSESREKYNADIRALTEAKRVLQQTYANLQQKVLEQDTETVKLNTQLQLSNQRLKIMEEELNKNVYCKAEVEDVTAKLKQDYEKEICKIKKIYAAKVEDMRTWYGNKIDVLERRNAELTLEVKETGKELQNFINGHFTKDDIYRQEFSKISYNMLQLRTSHERELLDLQQRLKQAEEIVTIKEEALLRSEEEKACLRRTSSEFLTKAMNTLKEVLYYVENNNSKGPNLFRKIDNAFPKPGDCIVDMNKPIEETYNEVESLISRTNFFLDVVKKQQHDKDHDRQTNEVVPRTKTDFNPHLPLLNQISYINQHLKAYRELMRKIPAEDLSSSSGCQPSAFAGHAHNCLKQFKILLDKSESIVQRLETEKTERDNF